MTATFLKKIGLAALIVTVAALFGGCGTQSDAKREFDIATGGTAGTYYPIGNAIADILNKEIPNMNAAAQSTGASVANLEMLREGTVELAIVQNDIAYYAVNGTEMFRGKKINNVRGIASLYPETCQFVTLDTSGIRSIDELKGKRVAVGEKGSGAEANARQILEIYGITYDDITPEYLSFADGAAALLEGKADAAFLTAGFPTAAVQEIAAKNKIRLLPIENDKFSILSTMYPYYTRTVIPAGTYEGFVGEVPTVSVMAILVGSDKIDDKIGRDIAKAVFGNLDKIRAAHSIGKTITKENAAKGMTVKMNTGAERYFRDNK